MIEKETSTHQSSGDGPSGVRVWRRFACRGIWSWILGALTIVVACGPEQSGPVQVRLTTDGVPTDGLSSGSAPGQIKDGWAVDFSAYRIAVGPVTLRRMGIEPRIDERTWLVDLSALPSSGALLWEFEQVWAGRWEFYYETRASDSETEIDPTVGMADAQIMVAEGLTHWIAGSLRRPAGQSCPPRSLAVPGRAVMNGNAPNGDPCYDATTLAFDLRMAAPASFGPCELDGTPGIVASAGLTLVSPTIHGDHLFFNGFPEGAEGGVHRYAQWLADCDLDVDGMVTAEELRQIPLSALPEIDSRFQLGGALVASLITAYDYVAAQLQTQGHFQGEGECPIRVP